MGSFDIGCGVSNLHIDSGNRTGVYLVSTRRRDRYSIRDTETKLCYINNTDVYKPIFPPVFGTYDDYGQLTNIEDSLTTKMLEKIFNRPIQVITDCIGNSFRGGAYDNSGPILKNYGPQDNKLLSSYSVSTSDILKSVGFVQESEDVYSFGKYQLVLVDGYKAQVKNAETGEVLADKRTYSSSGPLNVFSDATGIYPGFQPEDYEAVDLLNNSSAMFFLPSMVEGVYEEIQNEYLAKRDLDYLVDDWEGFQKQHEPKEELGSFNFSRLGERVSETLTRETHLPHQYFSAFANELSLDELLSIQKLLTVTTAVNRMIQPSYCGEQNGNDEASLALSKLSVAFLEARRAEWDEENGEYYDEDDDEDGDED